MAKKKSRFAKIFSSEEGESAAGFSAPKPFEQTASTDELVEHYSDADFEPSGYQAVLFDAVENGRGHIVVCARAGAGKSSSLERCVRLVAGKVLVCAFNKSIERAMSDRLRSVKNATTKTIHGLGFGMCRGQWGKIDLDAYKYNAWIRSVGREFRETKKVDGYVLRKAEKSWLKANRMPETPFKKLLDLARVNLFTTVEEVATLVVEHGVEIEDSIANFVYWLVVEAMTWGQENTSTVDFTDMIWLPVVRNLKPLERYSHVLVDECQDLSKAQFEVVKKMIRKGGRMLFVGDPAQCQPGDTMVAIGDGTEKRLSTVKVGDMVVTYDRPTSTFIRKGKVTEVAKRRYTGELVTVSAEGRTSRCTPNHRWVARWSERSFDLWCVYLMRNGTSFRVGMCQMFTGRESEKACSTFHPGQRARLEGADAVWILGVFEDQSVARLQEMFAAYEFGIPQTTFKVPCNANVLTQEVVDTFWARMGDLTVHAQACLEAHGRLLDYPLYVVDKRKRGRTTMFETQACNLMSKYMKIPRWRDNVADAVEWITPEFGRERFSGNVYSLNIEKHHKYVADGFATCNSIYGFAGADERSFDRIVEETNATVLPLSICYRCPRSHIEMAQMICPDIEAAPWAEEGVIGQLDRSAVHKKVKEGDLILCRNNAPLVGMCLRLIESRIPAVVRGRDLAKNLISIVNNIENDFEWEDFNEGMEVWIEEQIKAAKKRCAFEEQLEKAVENIRDRAGCVRVIRAHGHVDSFLDLCEEIDGLFSDDRASVVLSSVHKAKGLEEDRVFILEPGLLDRPGPQEENVKYVALTRAKKELWFVYDDEERSDF